MKTKYLYLATLMFCVCSAQPTVPLRNKVDHGVDRLLRGVIPAFTAKVTPTSRSSYFSAICIWRLAGAWGALPAEAHLSSAAGRVGLVNLGYPKHAPAQEPRSSTFCMMMRYVTPSPAATPCFRKYLRLFPYSAPSICCGVMVSNSCCSVLHLFLCCTRGMQHRDVALGCTVMLLTGVCIAVNVDDQDRILRAGTDPPRLGHAVVQRARRSLVASDRPCQCS